MTAYDYSRPQATALRMIARFGKSAAIRRTTPGAGPAHNPGAGTPTDYPATLVEVSARYAQRDATKIKAGDKGFLVSVDGLTIELEPSDKIVLDSQVWSIQAHEPLSPGATILLYTVHARR